MKLKIKKYVELKPKFSIGQTIYFGSESRFVEGIYYIDINSKLILLDLNKVNEKLIITYFNDFISPCIDINLYKGTFGYITRDLYGDLNRGSERNYKDVRS